MLENSAITSWETIDAALIRMRRLLDTPQEIREGVDLSAVLVVDAIARREKAGHQTRIVDVATNLAVKPSTASRLVSSTEASGLIHRSPSTDDPRSVILTLTQQGQDLNADATRFRTGMLKRAVPHWDAETTSTFARLLEEFSHAVSATPPASPDGASG